MNEELHFINSKINMIESKHMFSDMLDNLQNSNRIRNNNKPNSNVAEKNFIDMLDERLDKMDEINLRGNSYHLDTPQRINKQKNKTRKEFLPKIMSPSKYIK